MPPPRRPRHTKPKSDIGDADAVEGEIEAALASDTAPPSIALPTEYGSAPANGETPLEKARRLACRSVDKNLCLARTWKGRQCELRRLATSEFCKKHNDKAALGNLKHGRYDAYIDPEMLEPLLRDAARHDRPKSCKHYCRVTMWHYAAKHGVDSVEDLSDELFTECLLSTDTYLMKHQSLRSTWKLGESMGPATVDERWSTKVSYCGSPKGFKYYS